MFTAGTDCQANEKLPRQSRLTSSRVLWKSSPRLLFCRRHSISVFSYSLYFLLSFFPAFTCRVVAAVSKGGKKKLIESIEAKRKLTATGWLVLLFCLEINAAISLLEKGGSASPAWALSELFCVLMFLLLLLFSVFLQLLKLLWVQARGQTFFLRFKKAQFAFYSATRGIWMQFKCLIGWGGGK